MQRTVERAISLISGLTPILYGIGLLAGTMALYTQIFVSGRLLLGAVGCALEIHTLLMEFTTRRDYATYRRSPSPETRGKLKASVIVLGMLLAFQTYNSLIFTAATYKPLPVGVPGSLQIIIVGLSIPVFAFLSGFSVPAEADANHELSAMSHALLWRTLKSIKRQWSGRMQQAEQTQHNMSGAAVALLEDAGAIKEAARVRIMDSSLPGGIAPTVPTPEQPQPKPGKKKKKPTRTRKAIIDLRARREQTALDLLREKPTATLASVQRAMGMSNRGQAQEIWTWARLKLGIDQRVDKANKAA